MGAVLHHPLPGYGRRSHAGERGHCSSVGRQLLRTFSALRVLRYKGVIDPAARYADATGRS